MTCDESVTVQHVQLLTLLCLHHQLLLPADEDVAGGGRTVGDVLLSILRSCRDASLFQTSLQSSAQLETLEGEGLKGEGGSWLSRRRELLVCRAMEESDPDLLLHIFKALSLEVGETRDLKCLEKLVSRADQLFQRDCSRIELRVSLVHFLTTALPRLPQHQTHLQVLSRLLHHFEVLTAPTEPYQVREAIASCLLGVWPPSLTAGHDEAVLCCRLVMQLLQDADTDVREEMARAVSQQLEGSSSPGLGGLNPSSALKFFVSSSLLRFFPDPQTCWDVLLSLVPTSHVGTTTPTGHTVATPTNLLFDEDPINDYAEQLVVTQHVVSAMEVVLGKLRQAARLEREHYNSLLKQFPPAAMEGEEAEKEEEVEGVRVKGSKAGNIWSNAGSFFNLKKMELLSPLLASMKMEVGATEDIISLTELTQNTHL